MKVLLAAVNSKFIHSNLAVRYLKAYTENLDIECSIKEFTINDRKERILEEIIESRPDLVAFSCYIWNMDYVRDIAKLIKLVHPQIEILLGGPEVSYDSRELLARNSCIDYIIEGEGEESFKEFIISKMKNNNLSSVLGLFFRKDASVHYAGPRPLMDMNNITFPYNEEDVLKNKIVYYEASRGCPFKCKYCLSSTIHNVRFLKIERVKEDLKNIVAQAPKMVKFVDRTFNCNPKYAMEIWKYLSEINTECTFHFEISADLLKEDEIELLSSAPKGRFQFEVGVQTTNKEVLANINRYVNFNELKEKVLEVSKIKNIKQHLDLIAGLPGEDFHSFIKSFNDVYEIQPEVIQLGFLKVLKGSPMEDEADKWGIVYSPYPPYEVLKTKNISYGELRRLKKVEELVDKYYNSQKFSNVIKYFVAAYDKPFDFYFNFSLFLEKKQYYNLNIPSSEYYSSILDFNDEEKKVSEDLLKELLRYDYLKFNKKRGLPQWLGKKLAKDEETKVRNSLKDKNHNLLTKNLFFEMFSIDVLRFESENKIDNIPVIIAFDIDNNNEVYNVSQLTSN